MPVERLLSANFCDSDRLRVVARPRVVDHQIEGAVYPASVDTDQLPAALDKAAVAPRRSRGCKRS